MYGIKFDETSMVNTVNSSISLFVKEIPTTLQIINSPILSIRESRIPPFSVTKSITRAYGPSRPSIALPRKINTIPRFLFSR